MRVFVINAGVKRPDGSGGWLNAEMTRMAKEAFERRKIESIITDLNEKWDLEKEVEKVLGSDLLLVQTPIWAMSTPWQYTKWQDIVLTDPRVCGTDGRTRKDPNKLYGRRFSYEKALLDKYNMERSRGRRVRTRTIL